MAVIFITHDLAVAAQMADHMLVMEKGVVVEQGTPKKIFTAHQHPYTKKLLDAIPNSSKPPSHTQRHPEPLVQVNHLRTSFRLDRRTQVHAVNDISLDLQRGEILGLVGESGSGKSTLGRSIIRLIESQSGQVLFKDRKSTRLNSSHVANSYAVFCLKKKRNHPRRGSHYA